MNGVKSRLTKMACRVGMVTSAIVNNFTPLLFSVFRLEYGLSVRAISTLIAANFLAQILGALLSNVIIRRAGHRAAISSAHCAVGAGLIGLTTFPAFFPSPLAGLAAAVAVCGLGGGIINVVINPVIEGISGEGTDRERSLIYSFYCWGFIFVVAASTAVFSIWGVSSWRAVALSWAVVPFCGSVLFALAPIVAQNQKTPKLSLRRLLTEKSFLLVLILMFCAGAAEQSMAQWASLFAENGLGVAKAAGDIAGPCVFAALMGVSRALYSRIGLEARLGKYLLMSASACVFGYLLVCFAPLPALSFWGCGLIGLFVGILWPGILSLSSGGASVFATLVMAGNIGCAAGPAIVGIAAESFHSIRTGLLAGMLFPAALVGVLRIYMRRTA
jgi:fucose permease